MDLLPESSLIWDDFLRRPCPQVDHLSFLIELDNRPWENNSWTPSLTIKYKRLRIILIPHWLKLLRVIQVGKYKAAAAFVLWPYWYCCSLHWWYLVGRVTSNHGQSCRILNFTINCCQCTNVNKRSSVTRSYYINSIVIPIYKRMFNI